MAVRQPRYSKEEFAQRGDALYETQVRLPPVGFANDSVRAASKKQYDSRRSKQRS